MTILKQVSITGITSVGMCYVILTGGIDLSVGSIAGLSAVIAALVMQAGAPGVIGSLVALLVALAVGALNGFCVTKLNMPALIATLGTQTALRGLAYIVTDGLPVHSFSKTYGNFAKSIHSRNSTYGNSDAAGISGWKVYFGKNHIWTLCIRCWGEMKKHPIFPV